jgi:hypothetical protein
MDKLALRSFLAAVVAAAVFGCAPPHADAAGDRQQRPGSRHRCPPDSRDESRRRLGFWSSVTDNSGIKRPPHGRKPVAGTKRTAG